MVLCMMLLFPHNKFTCVDNIWQLILPGYAINLFNDPNLIKVSRRHFRIPNSLYIRWAGGFGLFVLNTQLGLR